MKHGRFTGLLTGSVFAGAFRQGADPDGVAEGALDRELPAGAAAVLAKLKHVAGAEGDDDPARFAAVAIEDGVARAGSPNEPFVYFYHPTIYQTRIAR